MRLRAVTRKEQVRDQPCHLLPNHLAEEEMSDAASMVAYRRTAAMTGTPLPAP